jgi:hypothetical protein
MSTRRLFRWGYTLAISTGLLGGCAQDKQFEGISVGRNGESKTPYLYNAVGKLDFAEQDPVGKANKVMLAACPHGLPSLMMADAAKIPGQTGDRPLLIAIFSCNQPIPGVE